MSKIWRLFHSSNQVICGLVTYLVTYTDWWQPITASVIHVGPARGARGFSDGIPPGLLGTLDKRSELCRRMQHVPERDRLLLFLWYVRQLPVEDIAREVGISRRQCFRRRAEAIRTIVKLGEPEEAA